jgi:hypothetical protein
VHVGDIARENENATDRDWDEPLAASTERNPKMGFASNFGAKLREHRRVVAAVLSITVIAVGVFLAGAWAGSFGAFSGGPVEAATQQLPDEPSARHAPDAPKPDGMCCGEPMAMNKDSNTPGGMSMGRMGADMSGGMSMGKMGADMSGGMSMGKMGADMAGGMSMGRVGPNMEAPPN